MRYPPSVAIELAMKDLYGRRSEHIFRLPASWEASITNLLADKRDLGIFLVFLQCSLWLTCSVAAQFYFLPRTLYSGRVVVAFLVHFAVTWALFGQRFILAMHYSAHRSLFSSKLGAMGTVRCGVESSCLSRCRSPACCPAGAQRHPADGPRQLLGHAVRRLLPPPQCAPSRRPLACHDAPPSSASRAPAPAVSVSISTSMKGSCLAPALPYKYTV